MEENEKEEVKEEVREETSHVVKPKKKSKAPIIVPIVITTIIAIGCVCILLLCGTNTADDNDNKDGKGNTGGNVVPLNAEYGMEDNTLSKFDLAFLKFENNGENEVYSPLSIKYALQMLSEGSDGETKEQIDGVIGNYSCKKYENSSNMSFANAMFIRDSYKDAILDDYKDVLAKKYNADIIYDSFSSPDIVNDWVSDKTFNLINKLVDDVSDKDYVLVNALAIDMEWVNKIQSYTDEYNVSFAHENFFEYVSELNSSGYPMLKFDGNQKVQGVQFAAVANKYDIVNDIGEDNIRKTVGDEYREWLKSGECEPAVSNPTDAQVNEYLDTYIEEIDKGYKHLSSSTDFYFNETDAYRVFAKDLKEYDGTTLQYVGIMPKNDSLKDFINDSSVSDINKIIGSLKEIDLDSFEEGYITRVTGTIPTFKFEYELKLMDDLESIGITDVFDSAKADLSGLTDEKGAYIDSASHQANIEFSNDGIKAGAATSFGGKGAYSCEFDYLYEVPTKEIDLTFDNPYFFLIRDKDTQEVWFVGAVYEPNEYQEPSYMY